MSLKNTLAIITLICLPFQIHASTITGDINSSSLSSILSRPTISGTAIETKIVKIQLQKENSNKKFYTSKKIRVKNNQWKIKIPNKLADGNYQISLFGTSNTSKNPIDQDILVIGKQLKSSFDVSSVPLLFGGMVRPGNSVPVAYLQITNTGTQSETLKGFWVKQNGNASSDAITALTTVDDRGGSRGSSESTIDKMLFNNNIAFVPTNLVFAPGEMRLFTIKATLGSSSYIYNGKQISLDVSAIEVSSNVSVPYSIKGTTWVINNLI